MGDITEDSFIRALALDADASLTRLRQQDSPSNRREAVRTLFAAIEGFSWVCREHVKVAAMSLDIMVPILEMALDEQTYFVSDGGKIKPQVRYISFSAMFRLIAGLANEICPDYLVEFKSVGWSDVLSTLNTRNKLMHPKNMSDLTVSDKAIASCITGFQWMLETTIDLMSFINQELIKYQKRARKIMDGLMRGDESILAQYQKALEIAGDLYE